MATPALVSTSLSALTSSNTVLQMMGDINSLKTLAPLASATSSQADLANTNVAIALLNTNLTATNTAIRSLNTATQSALDTQEAKQASNLANTNSFIAAVQSAERAALANTNSAIASVSSSALSSSDVVIKNVATNQSMKAKLLVDSEGASSGVDIANGHIQIFSATGSPSKIDFYCETGNAHKVTLVAPAHANYSGDVTVTLPVSSGTLATTTQAATTGKAIAMAIVFG